MQSLRDLNNYSNELIEFTDLRPPAVITTALEPVSFSFTETDRSFTVKNSTDILEIVRPELANVRYKINTGDSNSIVEWPIPLPAGTSVTQVGSVWTLYGVTESNWDLIKNPTIVLDIEFFGSFSYDVSIVYDSLTQANIEISWSVGIYAPQSLMQSTFAFTANNRRILRPTFQLQAAFGITASTRLSAFRIPQKFDWSISTVKTFVGPVLSYPTTVGTWTVTITPSDLAKVSNIDSNYTGGTKTYNAVTKVLTLIGTKEEVNGHLAALKFTATASKGDFNFVYTADNSVDDMTWEISQLANNLDTQYLNLPTLLTQTYTVNTPKLVAGASTVNDDQYDGSGIYTWKATFSPTSAVSDVKAESLTPKSVDDHGYNFGAKTITRVGTVGKSQFPGYTASENIRWRDLSEPTIFGSLWPGSAENRLIQFNGGYLTFDASSGDFNFGTNDFTIEFWLHVTAYSTTPQTLIDLRPTTASGFDASLCLQLVNGSIQFITQGQVRMSSTVTGSSSSELINVSGSTTQYDLVHVALTKSGTVYRLLLDGRDINIFPISSQSPPRFENRIWIDPTQTPIQNTTTVGAIGASTRGTLGSDLFVGYMSNIRISNKNRYPMISETLEPQTGTYINSPGYYTRTFDFSEIIKISSSSGSTTDETTLFRSDANTVLIPNQIGSGASNITDGLFINKTPRKFTMSGNATDNGDGTFTFNGGKVTLDNSDDQLDFGTGNFTIQFSVTHSSLTGNQVIYESRSSSNNDPGLTIYVTPVNGQYQLVVAIGGVIRLATQFQNVSNPPLTLYYLTQPYAGGFFTLARNNGVFTLYSSAGISSPTTFYNWGSYTDAGFSFSSTTNPIIGQRYSGSDPLLGTINWFKIDKQAPTTETHTIRFYSPIETRTFFQGWTIPNTNTLFFLHEGKQHSASQDKFVQSQGFTILGTREQINQKIPNLTVTPATNYNQPITVNYSVVTPRGDTNNHNATLTT